jgi:hypothetical protein
MNLHSQSKSKEKGITLKAKKDFDENKDSNEEIGLMIRQFNRMPKRKNR